MDNQNFEELLVRELTGEITAAERRQLEETLASNPARRKEYEIFKDYWTRRETTLPDTRSVFEKVRDKIRIGEKELEPSGDHAPVRRLWWRTAAAVLILGLGTLVYRYSGHTHATGGLEWQEKYAARKTRSQIVLSDGSTILLNADTRLRYPTSFDGPTREVYLSGEAFFDIQKDPLHPFIIHTNKMNIRVLGTSFNVKSYPGDASMETTLISGSVEVTFPDRPSDRIILKPKDKLVIGNGPAAPQAYKKKDVHAPQPKYSLTGLTYYPKQDSTVIETSWVDNKLAFSSEEFQDLARRMERWYGVRIVFDNPDLVTCHFTGIFQNETITEALYALQLSEKFQYAIRDSVIHIY
jgi:ferric-dicitrate binding protein FerR (iron transport regulator)